MAVPSSGQLSLFGIAMEKIHAAYAEPLPVPLGYVHVGPGMPTNEADHKIYDSPNNEPINDFYSTNLTVKRSSSPYTDEDPFANEFVSQNLPKGTNVLGDISLAAMQTGAPAAPALGHRNPTFTSNDGHPVTKLHQATYLGNLPSNGSVGFSATGAGHDHPAPTVQSSTVMYIMYIGDSDLSPSISPPTSAAGFHAIAFGFNPSIFQGGREISLGGPTHTGQYWGTLGPSPLPSPSAEPSNYEGLSFYHPQPNGINTSSPAPHPFPSTADSDLSMSNFYGYDHDYVAPTPVGVNMTSTAIFTGNQGTGLQTYSVDFSSPSHLGTTTVGHPATSIYYIVAYKNGAAPGPIQPYQGDIQLTSFQSYGPPSPFGASYGSNPSDSRTSVSNPPSPTPLNINPLTPSTSAGPVVTSYAPKMTTAVASPSTTNGRWNHRPSGGTPSGGTGVTDPTGYFYTETSGPTVRINQWFILVNPIGKTGAKLTSDTMNFKFYANGANVGSCFVGLWVDYPNT